MPLHDWMILSLVLSGFNCGFEWLYTGGMIWWKVHRQLDLVLLLWWATVSLSVSVGMPLSTFLSSRKYARADLQTFVLKWDHGNSNDGKLKSVTYLYTGFSYHEPSLKSQEILRTECIQIFRHGILQTVGWNETLLRAWTAILTAWQSADVLVRCVSTRGLGLFTFLPLQSCVWILNVSCLTVTVFSFSSCPRFFLPGEFCRGVYCHRATFVHSELAAEPVVD